MVKFFKKNKFDTGDFLVLTIIMLIVGFGVFFFLTNNKVIVEEKPPEIGFVSCEDSSIYSFDCIKQKNLARERCELEIEEVGWENAVILSSQLSCQAGVPFVECKFNVENRFGEFQEGGSFQSLVNRPSIRTRTETCLK